MELRRALGLPMIVVRFNPDGYGSDPFFGWEECNGQLRPTSSSTWAARLKTLVATIRRLVRKPPGGLKQGLGIHLQFLCYDEGKEYTWPKPATLEAYGSTATRAEGKAASFDKTPLSIASQEDHLEAVQRLGAQSGADLNEVVDYDLTRLHIASEYGHLEAV